MTPMADSLQIPRFVRATLPPRNDVVNRIGPRATLAIWLRLERRLADFAPLVAIALLLAMAAGGVVSAATLLPLSLPGRLVDGASTRFGSAGDELGAARLDAGSRWFNWAHEDSLSQKLCSPSTTPMYRAFHIGIGVFHTIGFDLPSK